MNILLIGASGMVGSRILAEAVSRKHSVVAAVRNVDKIETSNAVQAVSLDVNHASDVTKLAADADVVISAVSPRNSGDAVNDAQRFTESLIAASQASGKRILMVGGASSLHTPDGKSLLDTTPEFILAEATAMRQAYALMVTADIDFSVLAPGGMIGPGERTGKFRLGGRTVVTGPEGSPNDISAEDFAVAMLDEAEEPRHFRTIFNVGY